MDKLIIDILMSAFFVVLGGTIGAILYLSKRRATTEGRKYVYSPTYAPTMRTPKRTFAAFAFAMGLFFTAVAFHELIHSIHVASKIPAQALRVAESISDMLVWSAEVLSDCAVILLIGTTRRLGGDDHDASEPPLQDDTPMLDIVVDETGRASREREGKGDV